MNQPLTLIGVIAITLNGQIALSMLFKLSRLFNLTRGWSCATVSVPSTQPRNWVTHTLHTRKHTPMEKYDYLSGRSPLATDLLIEQTFFLPFNPRWYQSCWRIKWSLLELATIIKWQCDPRLKREWMRNRVLVCQSDSVCVSYAHTVNVYVTVSEGVDHNVFICFSCDSVEQALTTISKPWKKQI